MRPSGSGSRIRQGPTAPRADHSQRVRETFKATWRDFYAWAPLPTRPLAEARLDRWAASDDPALHLFESLIDDVEDESPQGRSTDSTSLKEVHSAQSGFTILLVYPRKTSVSGMTSAYTAGIKEKPLPAYTFASFLSHNLDSSEEHRCRFIPSWDHVDFDDDEYLAMFGHEMEGRNQGRNPACDIIAVETRSRLRAIGFEDSQIDATRVLPFICGRIDALSVERDLPPFPREPWKVLGSIVGDAADRVWEPQLYIPPEVDQIVTEKHCEEEFCTFAGCLQYGCPNHPQHVNDQMRLQADPVIRPVTLARPVIPCSRHCWTIDPLESALPWPEDDRQRLQKMLAETKGSACQSRTIMADRTCAEIAAQVEFFSLLPAVQRRPTRRGCTCLATDRVQKCSLTTCPCTKAKMECLPGVCLNGREGHALCGNMGTLEVSFNPSVKLRVGISGVIGYGLFVDQDCPKGTLLGEYTGESISGPESDKREFIYKAVGRNYMFEIISNSTGETVALVDGDRSGSLLRFINASSKPNCEAHTSQVSNDPRMTFVTNRAMKRGEELLLNYGTKFFLKPSGGAAKKRKRTT